MIKAIIDGEEIKPPPIHYKHIFTTREDHKVDTLYILGHLIDLYKNSTYGLTRVTKAILSITE